MPQFFFEIYQEEIPARMQVAAEKQLKELLAKILEDLTIQYQSIKVMITPLRLIGCIEGIDEKSQENITRIRGPKETADAGIIKKFKNSHLAVCHPRESGDPEVLSVLLDPDIRQDDKLVTFTGFDGYIYAEKVTAPTPTPQLIPQIMDQILTKLSWPKSMRWPGSSIEWVRPIRRVYCQFDAHPLIFDLPLLNSVILGRNTAPDRGSIKSETLGSSHVNNKHQNLDIVNGSSVCGALHLAEDDSPCFSTSDHVIGHRFMSPQKLQPINFDNYLELLGQNNVMPDHQKRMEYIHQQLSGQGYYLTDQNLLEENAGLAEWPIVYIGAIDQQFLTLPREVLSTTMKVHQRYFTFPDRPVFGVVANAMPEDGSTMVAGYEHVLRARLSDAQFFYQQDCTKKLEDFAKQLTSIVFHKNIGTLADKTKRLEAFMDTPDGKTAARLCKADLATSIVYEFPELQGTMGRVYGEQQGLSSDICTALEQHHWPLGANQPLPTTLLAAQLSFSDKLDTLLGLLGTGVKVSGSKDPLGLRRCAIGVIRLIQAFGFECETVCKHLQTNLPITDDAITIVSTFIKDRAEVYFNDPLIRGLAHLPITTMIKRYPNIQSFMQSETGAEFLTQYKRLCGLLKPHEKSSPPLKHSFEIILNDWNIKHIELTDIENLQELTLPMRDYFDQVKILEGTPETVNGRLTLLATFKEKVEQFCHFSFLDRIDKSSGT